MPNEKNIKDLSVLKEKKEKAKAAFFTHYRGLTVNQMTQLRNKIREVDGELMVSKNTLLRIAFGNDDLSKQLDGPTAVIFAYGDEVAPVKIVAEFSKNNELPTFTAGYFDGRALTADDMVRLSNIPGKQELYAKVVGSLASPLSGMVNVLQGNLRNLVYVLNAVKDQKAA